MNISVELTLMPLKNDFEPLIKNFIKRLRDSEFTVLENPLSTQVYGEYDNVMSFLTKEIKTSFENESITSTKPFTISAYPVPDCLLFSLLIH